MTETAQFISDVLERPRPGNSRTEQRRIEASWLATLRDIEAGCVPERRPASEFDGVVSDLSETLDLIDASFPVSPDDDPDLAFVHDHWADVWAAMAYEIDQC